MEEPSARLKIAALLAGEPGPLEHWTLRALSRAGFELAVVQAERFSPAPRWRRWAATDLSRLAASAVARLVKARDRAVLAELLDAGALAAWRRESGLVFARVETLNGPDGLAAAARAAPDLLVTLSGGPLKPRALALPRLAALDLRHGLEPAIRGVWSIPWAIVEGRPEWIGAAVRRLGPGPAEILWRGAPQIAAGDTALELIFRAHLEAVDALVSLARDYARGRTPPAWSPPPGAVSEYRGSPGLGAWARFLALDRGRKAPSLLERGLRC